MKTEHYIYVGLNYSAFDNTMLKFIEAQAKRDKRRSFLDCVVECAFYITAVLLILLLST